MHERGLGDSELLDALMRATPAFVTQLELDGTIVSTNRVIPPHTMQDVIGTKWLDYFRNEERECLERALSTVVTTGEPFDLERRGVGPNGTSAWYATRIGPLRRAKAIIGTLVISVDITSRKHTEAQLIANDRMASVGKLIGSVVHEINNPLTSVIANIDLAMSESQTLHLPREMADGLRDARSAGERVRALVHDLGVFSRPNEVASGPVDIERVLDSTVRLARNELKFRARVVRNFARVPPVHASESQLAHVFLNLVVNAARAIPEGDYDNNTIELSTSTEEGRVVVTVADSGAGISEELRPHIFTPFTQDSVAKTGLGLFICNQIVTTLGGSISFRSVLGQGSTFRVVLPMSKVAPKSAPPLPKPARPTRRGRVLVVDDDVFIARAIRRTLESQHDVVATENAQKALEQVADGERFDVILCDLLMPQVSGMEFYDRLRAIDEPQAKCIVFITGGAFTNAARAFLENVPNRHIDKPLDIAELRDVVASMVK